jgi:hypothetical protein
MIPTTNPIAEKKIVPAAENKKGIENDKKTAGHLEAAVKHHLDSIKYHEAGEDEKAAMSSIAARGHYRIAKEARKED